MPSTIPKKKKSPAGRSGQDFKQQYITDGSTYGEMLVYLVSLMNQYDKELQVAGPDDDIPTEFYGTTYERICTMQASRDSEYILNQHGSKH